MRRRDFWILLSASAAKTSRRLGRRWMLQRGLILMSESSNPIENTSPEPLGADVEIALPADCVAQIREGVVWIDGDSSRRCRAMLGVRGKKIVAVNERGEECTVSLAKIKISSRLGSAPRQFLFANGTAIMVDDNDAADDLIRQVGGSSLGLHHFEHGQRIVALIVALAMAYWIIIVHAIPAVADFAAHRVSQKHLATISDDVYQHFINAEILSPSKLPQKRQQRIHKLFDSAAAPWRDNFPYQMHIHHLGAINAFALPSGIIVMSDELAKLLTDDEMLAVFLHEVGHVEKRHGMRGLLAAAGVGLLFALAGDVSFVLSGGAILLQFKYSRNNETESDCFAARELRRRNMSPNLLGEALQKMTKVALKNEDKKSDNADSAEVENDPEFWRKVLAAVSTHPSVKERAQLEKVCDFS